MVTKFESIEKLTSTPLIYEDNYPASKEKLKAVRNLMLDVMKDCNTYIYNLDIDDTVFCISIASFTSGSMNIVTNNTTYTLTKTAFILATENIWEQLRENQDNPVYEVISYIIDSIRGIRQLLRMHGIDDSVTVTSELLEQEGIVDLLGLHRIDLDFKELEKQMGISL